MAMKRSMISPWRRWIASSLIWCGCWILFCGSLLNSGHNNSVGFAMASEVQALHPFLTETCTALVEAVESGEADTLLTSSMQKAFVVMYVQEDDKFATLHSVKSILDNSISKSLELARILVIDDALSTHISHWPEWGQLTATQQSLVRVIRQDHHLGIIESKNAAITYISEFIQANRYKKESSMLVFMDTPSVVSPHWLSPLSWSLSKKNTKIVYPSMDILIPLKRGFSEEEAKKDSGYEIVRGDGVVAAFSWEFIPRWEPIAASDRLSKNIWTGSSMTTLESILQAAANDEEYAGSGGVEEPLEVLSPGIPSVFATTIAHLEKMGGFDFHLAPSRYGHENMELAIRTWLCGSMIVRVACSRVATQHEQLLLSPQSRMHIGTTEHSLSQNVMTLATRFLNMRYNPTIMSVDGEKNPLSSASKFGLDVTLYELAYQARFGNNDPPSKNGPGSGGPSIPYPIDVTYDPLVDRPSESTFGQEKSSRKLNSLLECQDFNWYLAVVYPGLVKDMSDVLSTFGNTISDDTHNSLIELVDAFHKSDDKIPSFSDADENTVAKLAAREDKFRSFKTQTLRLPARAVERISVVEPPNPMDRYVENIRTHHIARIRRTLNCTDINLKTSSGVDYCVSETTTRGTSPNMIRKVCEEKHGQLMFLCPKTCGWCSISGEYCDDFYLTKCKAYSAAGRCGTTDAEIGTLNASCRRSCKQCIAIADTAIAKTEEKKEPPKPANSASEDESNGGLVGRHKGPLNQPLEVDPKAAFNAWVSSEESNPIYENEVKSICGADKARAAILNQITVSEKYSDRPPSGVRIFCGIFTYEKSHKSAVTATIDTWARKCDGFLAFSTVTDPAVQAQYIPHEGREEYENMWQKSRSIWKFVYENLRNDYDYFLLGGDDMFFIVENLREYLNSPEIVEAQKTHDGLYLGRVFHSPNSVFNSGGAGAILDTKALAKLYPALDTGVCFPHQRGFWEDVNTSNCLATVGIKPFDTRDALGRERLHPFLPEHHYTYQINPNDWYTKYNPDLKTGLDCCSSESISFHYAKRPQQFQLYHYVYHCPNHPSRSG